MKFNKLLIIFVIPLICTGCTKKYTCTSNQINDYYSLNEEINLKYKKESLIYYSKTDIYEINDTYISIINNIYDSISSKYDEYENLNIKKEIDDNKIYITVDTVIDNSIKYDFINQKLSKKEMIKFYENQNYICK